MAKNDDKLKIVEATALAPTNTNLPAGFDAAMLLEDAGAGTEDMGMRDLSTPFLSILQQLSPQVNKRDSKYIEGAEASMIHNAATHAIYDGEQGVLIVPCGYQRRYTEWKPNRGGLVKDWGTDESGYQSCNVGEKGQHTTGNGNVINEAAVFYAFLLDGGSVSEVIIQMSGTEFKKAKGWNSLIKNYKIPHPTDPQQQINPAIFYSTYRMTTVPEQNDQGNWFGWKIEKGADVLTLPNGGELYMKARGFRNMFLSGKVKAPQVQEPGQQRTNDDIPF